MMKIIIPFDLYELLLSEGSEGSKMGSGKVIIDQIASLNISLSIKGESRSGKEIAKEA